MRPVIPRCYQFIIEIRAKWDGLPSLIVTSPIEYSIDYQITHTNLLKKTEIFAKMGTKTYRNVLRHGSPDLTTDYIWKYESSRPVLAISDLTISDVYVFYFADYSVAISPHSVIFGGGISTPRTCHSATGVTQATLVGDMLYLFIGLMPDIFIRVLGNNYLEINSLFIPHKHLYLVGMIY